MIDGISLRQEKSLILEHRRRWVQQLTQRDEHTETGAEKKQVDRPIVNNRLCYYNTRYQRMPTSRS
jgi:hypothetical protein